MKPYRYKDCVILIFCKAPVPGQVKTRLSPYLTSVQAAQIHIELSLKTIRLATKSPLCAVQLYCAPTIEHPFFVATASDYPLLLCQQQGHNLGERMHHAFVAALSTYRHALLMGCDCPSLTATDLQVACTALREGHDVVLAPAEDGGYVLIGLNQAQPALFKDIDWGTASVFAQTQQRIRQQHLNCHLLPEQWDVDLPEDLQRYRAMDLE
jgi:rSAM/selenodomain-associated transferase 1